jgi:GT2 family glycosyltransferase
MTAKARALPFVLLLLPLDLIVTIVLLTAQILATIKRRLKPATTTGTAGCGEHVVAGFSPRSCTIIVLNWDGKHLLAESLPAVIEAVRFNGGNHQIMVVDNGSADGSSEFVRSHFPQIHLLALDRNYGFAGGNNRGAEHADTEIVVFLNNDMIVDRNFLKPLLDGFHDSSVFAVTSQIFFADPTRRREETGKTRALFERGFFELWHGEITSADEARETVPVFWAGGGSCAIDRRKYLAIGGLDTLYHPFYIEDTDLSYQAWKRGWKCLLAPASKVVHKHRSTTRPKFGHDFVENTIRKNRFLLIWKNVSDTSMLVQHLANLPRIHGREMIQNGAMFEVRAYWRAVRQLPEAASKRLSNQNQYLVSDREVLARTSKA